MIIKDNSLPQDVLEIIRRGATERPHTATDNELFQLGTYLCRGCGAALFRAHSKFNASCGWPSFDEALTHAVTEKADRDLIRTEIVCARCAAHLGHVFMGERLTAKNKRYCVNSKSLDFIENTDILDTEEAIIAGGCFWGVEYYLGKLSGVLRTEVGYTGGEKLFPSYYEVCAGNTGHFEAVRIIYAPSQLDYKALLKYFFEIHDPSQVDGQGPDRGSQYQSAVFYYNHTQKKIAEELINTLQQNMSIATKLLPVTPFWSAEMDHQHYYDKTQHQPYCHVYTKRFKE
ncbi:MAG: bifunctional methionine sulfoxide reductase B/A protein [Legionellaceae bacterium]|nr:bifunctional methionine sulfoxide reductase B/A protein [Legionellaceae bacterium]